MSTSRRRAVVGLSGGVDSTAAACWLQQEGWEVIGASLRLGLGPGEEAALERAAAAARHLGIEQRILDVAFAFEQRVLRPCWAEYQRGRTPNPCARCNPDVKFAALIALADTLGASRVATGHHARVEAGPQGGRLLRGRDRGKDQSYFLFGLTDAQLGRLLLPLGERTKAEARALVAGLGLAPAPESQDACLAQTGPRFPEALRLYCGAEARPGEFVSPAGRALGAHGGLHRFTIGQRQGLGLALGQPGWVVALRPDTAQVVVSTDPADLLCTELRVEEVRWLESPAGDEELQVQLRSRTPPAPARLEPLPADRVRVVLEQAQRAVTPGQAAVFYRGDQVLGGGWIA